MKREMKKIIQKIGKGINIKEKQKSIRNKEDQFLLDLIQKLCELENSTSTAFKNGINLFEYEEKYIYIIKDLIKKVYGEVKSELIIWWVFESISPDGKVLPLIDEELKEHVIKTPKQLIKFLKRYNGK
tara:strand:- start:3717 stop:4100 length:384 start_codon:yes stop_codon:yes gene_type:complete